MSSRQNGRRGFLKRLGAVASLSALSGCYYPFRVARLKHQQQVSGSSPFSFASQRHRIKKAKATHIVNNRSQLIGAVGTQGAIVWVPSDVTIDVSGETKIKIANNVTIASNRNLKQALGGMIKTTDQNNPAVFVTENENVNFRVTGVRLKGPRTDYFDPKAQGRGTYDYAVTGFRAYGRSVIVDNCEVFGWTGAGFTPGTKDIPTQGWFHHNSMHHNQMAHLGYPMDLLNGQHLIEWNYFDANRHSIAGFGRSENAYEARFNVVGSNVDHPSFFQFDMHSLGENIESGPNANSNMAGKYVNVHHNVFQLTEHNALSLSGAPKMYARFCRNWCADGEDVIDSAAGADLRKQNNVFGPQTVKQGGNWLKQLAAALAQRASTFFSTQPSPTALPTTLAITQPPAISGKSSSSKTPMTPTPKPTPKPTTNAQYRSPITGTALTPVDGGEI